MWLGLISMQTGDSDAAEGGEKEGGMSAKDQVIANICNDILKRMEAQKELKYSVTRPTGLTPTEVVLCQEIERYNALAERIVATLTDLRRALKGEIGMSADLDEIGNCLYNGFLPSQWRRLAPLTEKALAGWMEFTSRRHFQYSQWAETGEPPSVLWLSGLHIPESHLSALVQTTCRAKGWALDKSQVFTEMTNYREASEVGGDRLEFGTYIEGLYLEGADWDLEISALTQQQPKQLVSRTPIMKIVPIEASDPRIKDQGLLATPVYYTQQRRNAMGVGFCFEAALRMPASDKPSRWVLQGVALFLNIDV
jgi:dynein heavy chain